MVVGVCGVFHVLTLVLVCAGQGACRMRYACGAGGLLIEMLVQQEQLQKQLLNNRFVSRIVASRYLMLIK